MVSNTRGLNWLAMGLIAAAVGSISAPASADAAKKPVAMKAPTETATFAAGCFWSMEAIFKQLKGVVSATPGYAGGKAAHPTYDEVETGKTGYAEALNVVFDPKVITYRDLLDVLLTMRDPTSLNRQGNDEGPQYRSIIFFRNEEQKRDAKEMIAKFTASKVWPRPIVTEIQPYTQFWRAENEHIDYYRLHPDQGYCRVVIAPEIAEFRAKFKSKLK